MHGPLSEIGLIEVLQLLERGGQSGLLRITGANPADACGLRITGGQIVALEPAAGDIATRNALVARHLVTDADAADDPGVLLWPQAIAMRQQLAAQALAAMLHWRQGRFDFETAAPEAGPLALLPDSLAFGLVASETRRLDLAPLMHDFRAVPDFTASDVLAAGDPPALTSLDWRLLDQVDGVRDVAALAVAVDEPLEDVAESIQLLHGALILELRRPVADARLVARTAIEAGRYEEAATLLRARVVDHPDDVEGWRALGLAEVGAGRFERAIEAWQSWRSSDPDRADDAAALMQAARTMVEALRDARD
jgi:tetratricopeptide (TPR) repeat protein